MDGVTTTMTSFIDVQNATSNYPKGFITLPHMTQQFGTARNATGALVLVYLPLVQPSELELWNQYSESNQDWVDDPIVDNRRRMDTFSTIIWDYPQDVISPTYECTDEYINNDSEVDQERVPVMFQDGPFAPLWTFSSLEPGPRDASIINQDLFGRDQFERAIQSVDITRNPMFLDICNMANNTFKIQTQEDDVEAVLAFPVEDDFSTTPEIVGHLVLIIPWKHIFQVGLPANTKPCHVVLESSCGQVTTYEIRDHDVKLLAKKDVHNREFDASGVSELFAEFANPPDLIEAGLQAVCVYTATVYPTTEFHATFHTQKPISYTMFVLAIFILTAGLFCLFDVLMTRQRNRVMETAEKQNAIVSSLFPKNIQAKMLQEVDADSNKLSKTGKAGLKNYLFDSNTYGDGGDKQDVTNGDERHRRLDKSKPIADLFPETTIMFGDIAG